MAENMNESVASEEQTLDEAEVSTLTLNEIVQYEDNIIEDTAAVLGAMNDKTCSYSEGYVKRQALYSCLTCIPESKTDPEKSAGVCLACSYHCHDGHELVELYTKRNFRCDCGNNKFGEIECNLLNTKDDFNDLNTYNQNYQGTYCICHRPYPDPDDPVPDEMLQCILCEDWYHARHLGTALPSNSFAELICERCIEKHDFLLHYDALCNDKTIDADVDVEKPESPVPKNLEQETTCKKPKDKSEKISAKFWQDISWRKQLCTCPDCLKMYENEEVRFLLDHEDPVQLYEEKGKAKAKEIIEDHDRNLMKNMNRVQLVETIAGYNDLKSNLAEFLKKFAENKKVVREEDIKEFFEGMQAKKKQKVEVPYYCR